MNRYSNYSVSAYSPMSFQEIASVPLLKRKQHDEMSKNLIDLGVIPVDPLDKHRDEALQLKQDLESRLTNLSSDLASKGIDGLGKESFLKLQKERNDLIAPTGRIGMINEAKKIYNNNFKEYLEDATKNKGWSRERALNNWYKNHHDKYTGYDDEKNILNIGQYGAPKKIEVLDKLKDVHSLLGEQVVSEISANGYGFAPGPNGSMIMVDRSGRKIETSNKPNLQSALNLLENQFVDKEWTDSRNFEGVDSKSAYSQIINGINSMLKTGVVDNRSENAQYIAPREEDDKDPENPNYEGVNVEGVSITRNSDLLDKLSNPPKEETSMEHAIRSGAAATFTGNKYNRKQTIHEVLNSPEYLTLARSIQRTQKINVKSLKDPKVQDAVKKYLNENKDVTIQNRYVDPNTNKQGMLFASKELTGKDSGERASNLILDRARRGAYDVVDEEGNKIDKNDLGKYTFTYNGDMTAKSQIGKKGKGLFTNPKQNIGARTGVLIDKETGEAKTVYVSRSSDDFDTPQFKAMETINGISRIADVQPGIYHQIKSPLFTAYGMKNVEIKYNKNKGTYDLSYTNSQGIPVDTKNIPDEVFQKNILKDYKKLYNE